MLATDGQTLQSWETRLMDVYAFSLSIFLFVNEANGFNPVHGDLENRASLSADLTLTSALDEEEEQRVSLLKAQNAAMLARMSALMGNMKNSNVTGVMGDRDEEAILKRKKEEQERQRLKMLASKQPREDYGLKLADMKRWIDERNAKLLKQEDYTQEMAVGRVRGFLNAVRMVTRLQTWWRMVRFRLEFALYRAGRVAIKQEYFLAWKRMWKSDRMHLYQTIGKPFLAWAQEVRDAKNLGKIVREFYANCIKRLKLTPQAVMVFFAHTDENEDPLISEADALKLRRLILVKLFLGWRTETRELRGRRFKGAQILTRTMRKHKGPLWVKEGVMVCYHVWHRYAAVRAAYKRNEPDAVYKNPHLPQWHRLIQKITMTRIHHKRAQEKGQMLVLKRNFRTWRFIMTMDKSKLMTPMAIAVNHYNNKVWTKVFGAWSGILKERGGNARRRTRCFAAWKAWAPKTKRMRVAELTTVSLIKAALVRSSWAVMTAVCFEVIGKRAEALRVLKDNFKNRKLLICAYALANRDSHVIMLDCWRRWGLWSRNRQRWQSTLWQYRYLYHDTKMRAIVQAWRELVRAEKEATLRLVSGIEGIMTVQVSHNRLCTVDDTDAPGSSDASAWSDSAQHHCLRVFHLAQKNSFARQPDPAAFLLFCRVIVLSSGQTPESKKRSEDLQDAKDEESLADSLTEVTQQQSAGSVGSRGGSVGSLFHGGKSVHSKRGRDDGSARHDELLDEGEDGEDDEEDHVENNVLDDLSVSVVSGAAERSLTESVKLLLAQGPAPPDPRDVLQDKLQRSVDLLDMRLVALAVEEGAVIGAHHVRQVANHFGDGSNGLFVQLLAGSIDFVAQRVLAQDREAFALQCCSPLNALVANTHIRRWEERIVTQREIKHLTQDQALSNVVGSLHSGTTLFRAAVVLALKKREDVLRAGLRMLKESRTVEQEVAETLKRNKLARLVHVRRSLMQLTGMSGIDGGPLYDLNEYLPPPPVVGAGPKRPEPDLSWVKSLNLEQLLHEFTTLMSDLTTEALALRRPQVERDDKLLLTGFLSQSRKDFLALREATMPAAANAKAKEKVDEMARKVCQGHVKFSMPVKCRIYRNDKS